MKYILLLCGLLALTQAFPSYEYPIHPGVGSIVKGPSSETIISGPDGSVITSAAEGGVVAVSPDSPPVVHVEPVLPIESVAHYSNVAAVSAPGLLHAGPSVLSAGPGLIHSNPSGHGLLAPTTVVQTSVSNLGPAVFHENPIIVDDIGLVEHDPNIIEEHVVVGDKIITVPKQVQDSSDLIGPSGTISIRGGDAVISGPASTTIKGGGVVASIDKQPDVKINTIELKPVVAPAIIEPVRVIKPAPLITESRTIITSGPVISEAKPLLTQVYAPTAPVLAADPLLGTKIVAGPYLGDQPSIIGGGHGLNVGLHESGVVLENNPHFHPHLRPYAHNNAHYGHHLGPHLPLYRGPFH